MKSIIQTKNLKGKKVLVRADFNVPIKSGKTLDDTRILASLPTIQYLVKKGAKVIVITQIGRPNGKIIDCLRVEPIVKKLETLLNEKIKRLDSGDWKLSDKKKTAFD